MRQVCCSSPILIVVLALACACTPLPDIPPLANHGGPAPALMPMAELMSGIAAPRATDAASDALAVRAARLRARAGLMRAPVLNPETRQKLAQAIARGDA